MNALTRDLADLTRVAESQTDGKDRFRQKLHLMPPTGWLNDPNGLCQFKEIYHAFFQYSPFNATGGLKMWGHYTSRDMIEWKYEGVACIRISRLTAMACIRDQRLLKTERCTCIIPEM